MRVLVVDVGGSNIKLGATGADEHRRLTSGRHLTPQGLVNRVTAAVRDWRYDVISLGVPGAVGHHGPQKDPGNLAEGWVGFDFNAAFGKPVRVVNDAVMQALGAYDGGRMLFLGLGTGLGSALVTDHVVIPLELGDLRIDSGEGLGDRLGRRGLEASGLEVWRREVSETTETLANAFRADYVVLGGGNARKVGRLPQRVRRGGNHDALTGGFRLWEETVEPHDRKPPPVWRVVQ
jgi:polyphosphate glucokinase